MAFAIIVRLFTVMHTVLLVLANSAGEDFPQACPPCPAPATPLLFPSCAQSSIASTENKAGHLVKGTIFGGRKRHRRTVSVLSPKCSSVELHNILEQSIGNDAEESKLAIVSRAEAEIGGRFDVICASGVFSYYAVARLFCEVKIGSVSCLAFRHDAIDEELSRKSPESKETSAEGTWKDDGEDRKSSVVNVEGDVKLLRRKGRMSDQRAVPSNPTNMDPISSEQEIDDEDQSWSSVRMRRPWRIPAHEYTAEEAKVHALREETLAELDELERRQRKLEILGRI